MCRTKRKLKPGTLIKLDSCKETERERKKGQKEKERANQGIQQHLPFALYISWKPVCTGTCLSKDIKIDYPDTIHWDIFGRALFLEPSKA